MDTHPKIPSVEIRTEQARDIILRLVPTLDTHNVKGIMAFGSFWKQNGNRMPHDIDLAIYCDNDASFDDDREKINGPLFGQFGLRVEFHVITPYASMIRRQINYKEYLEDGELLWGKMPDWTLNEKRTPLSEALASGDSARR